MKKFYMYGGMSTCKSWLLKVDANAVFSTWQVSPSRDITLHADNLIVIEPLAEPKHTHHAQEIFGQIPESHQTPSLYSEGGIQWKGYPVCFTLLHLSRGVAGQFTVAMSDRPPGTVTRHSVYNAKSTEMSDSPHLFHFRINMIRWWNSNRALLKLHKKSYNFWWVIQQ